MSEFSTYLIPISLFIILILQVFILFKRKQEDSPYIRETLDTIERLSERTQRAVRDELSINREEMISSQRQTREELSNHLKSVGDTLNNQLMNFSESSIKTMTEIASLQKSQLDFMHGQLNILTESNEKKMEGLRITIEAKLKEMIDDNAKHLEQIRITVDEKLQGTLEKRLGESFRQVSERLEQVYKGLGEMQALASGVGDLKKVLTNVKTRGIWGEIQLGVLLEQVLAPDQYGKNVSTKEGGERVEFAVKLPGRTEDREDVVWLPIDAKFPLEDYQRLIDAQERGDTEQTDAAGRQLELRIRQCASDICNKYINPPKTTDFGILFLPTEGLFAEVIRRSSLTEYVQRECRVVIAGPTTLWSILNSLQMGFRTLAIERRSSEVWKLLGAIKTEWTKYGDILAKVQKKLHEASETIDSAQTKTRVIGRKLKDVQMLPVDEARAVLNTDDNLE